MMFCSDQAHQQRGCKSCHSAALAVDIWEGSSVDNSLDDIGASDFIFDVSLNAAGANLPMNQNRIILA